MSGPGAPAKAVAARPYLIPMVVAGGLLVGGGAVVAGVLLVGAGGANAGDDALMTATPTAAASTAASTATPTASPTPAPSPTATAAPTVAPPLPPPGPIARIPGDCTGLYSESMFAVLSAAAPELNPPGFKTVAERVTSPELAAALTELPPGLECHWRVNLHSGIGTEVVPVDAVQAAHIEALLAEGGYTSIAEPWGTRWVIEFTQEYTWGESHTLVGGVWFATAWLEIAPDGYTADMVDTIVF